MYGNKTYSEEMVEKFFKRLEGTNGNIKLTCKSLGISTSTPQNWKLKYPEFAERLKQFNIRIGNRSRWDYI